MKIALSLLLVLIIGCSSQAQADKRDVEGCVELIVKALDNGGEWTTNPFLEDACDAFRTRIAP